MEAHQIRDQKAVSGVERAGTSLRKILVVKTRAIGDNIIMLPALRVLRQKHPEATIEVLTNTESAPPLVNSPLVDHVHSFRKKEGLMRRIWETMKVLKTIRKKRFDLAINFQASSGSEMLTVLCGAKRRLIYPYHYGRRSRFSHFNVSKPLHAQQTVMEDIAALAPLGIRIASPGFEYPLSSATRRAADEILWKHGICIKQFIAIHPGGGESDKRWSPGHFGALIDMIDQWLSLPVVILFTEGEKSHFDDICQEASAKPIGMTVSFDLLAAIIEKSRMFVGSDSAPHHVACALGIPSVVLMPRDHRRTWHPYDGTNHRVLIGELGRGTGRYIDRIKPEEVFSVLKTIMELDTLS